MKYLIKRFFILLSISAVLVLNACDLFNITFDPPTLPKPAVTETKTYTIPAGKTVPVYMVKSNRTDQAIAPSNQTAVVDVKAVSGINPSHRASGSTNMDDSFALSAEIQKALAEDRSVSGFTDKFVRWDHKEAQNFVLPAFVTEKTGNRSASVFSMPTEPSKSFIVNTSTRDFHLQNTESKVWTKERATLRAEGTKCLLWVLDENFDNASSSDTDNKITASQVKAVADKFDSLYAYVTGIFGDKYTTRLYTELIVPKEKISILVYDIDKDASPTQKGGMYGYFWSKDFLLGNSNGEVYGKNGELLYKTNADELFYIDAFFLEKDKLSMYSTLAHEFQHMLHFVNKSVRLNQPSETWYNEMLSMLCEDVLQQEIGIGPMDSPISRLSLFNQAYALSGITDWLPDGEKVLISYANAYAFGAYLARSFGGPELIASIAKNNEVDKKSISLALKPRIPSGEDGFVFAFSKYPRAMLYKSDPNYTFNKSASSTINFVSYKLAAIDLWSEDFKWTLDEGKTWRKGPGLFKKDSSLELRPWGMTLHYLGDFSGTIAVTFNKGNSASENVEIIY